MIADMNVAHAARRFAAITIASLVVMPVAGVAQAQEYPAKPIRFVVPAAPGGGTDVMARVVSSALGDARKWQFVIENLPGAGGNIGLDHVAKAPRDGYTIGIGESSNMIINAFLYSRIPFNIETDLEPVVLLAKVPLVLVVSNNSRYDSVAAIISAAKQKPLSFASAGNGTLGHLMGELWKRKLGADMMHVPYKSAAPAMTDVAGGAVDYFFASIASGLPLINAGKVKALAVAAPARSPLLATVPTMSEQGQKDIDASVVFGVMAPKGTPAAVVIRLNTEINGVLKSGGVRQTMAGLGADDAAFGGDTRQFAALLAQERQTWGRVVKESGARVD